VVELVAPAEVLDPTEPPLPEVLVALPVPFAELLDPAGLDPFPVLDPVPLPEPLCEPLLRPPPAPEVVVFPNPEDEPFEVPHATPRAAPAMASALSQLAEGLERATELRAAAVNFCISGLLRGFRKK
jgi:hypothetical protein